MGREAELQAGIISAQSEMKNGVYVELWTRGWETQLWSVSEKGLSVANTASQTSLVVVVAAPTVKPHGLWFCKGMCNKHSTTL